MRSPAFPYLSSNALFILLAVVGSLPKIMISSANPTSIGAECVPEEPLFTPPNEGTVQFLSPDTVKYISPPRVSHPLPSVKPIGYLPPTAPYSFDSPPPSYQPYAYSSVPASAPPLQSQTQLIPASMPMLSHQYMVPQMAPMVTHQQQLMCMPTMQPSVVTALGTMAQLTSPVQLTSPQFVQAQPPPQPQQPSPGVTVNVNQSPLMAGISGGNSGTLICPKCRRGIIMRKQNRFRKFLWICLAICSCPLTCGLPLLCLCCNYEDTCGACRKRYGHRGRKNYKKNVNAVKL